MHHHGSCVSATAQILSDGKVLEKQVLSMLGEWADPMKLPQILNNIKPTEGTWKSGYFRTADDALF